jgi:hypothetical protein
MYEPRDDEQMAPSFNVVVNSRLAVYASAALAIGWQSEVLTKRHRMTSITPFRLDPTPSLCCQAQGYCGKRVSRGPNVLSVSERLTVHDVNEDVSKGRTWSSASHV